MFDSSFELIEAVVFFFGSSDLSGIDWVFFRTCVLSTADLLLFAGMELDYFPCLVDDMAAGCCVLLPFLLELFCWRDT